MIISRKTLDDFTLQLGNLGDTAEAEVRAKLASRMNDLRVSGADATEELRSLAASVLDANDETYGAASASLGLRVFGETLGTRPGEADELDVAALVRKSNAASARYWAGFLDGTDEGFERFLDGISAKTRRNVTHMADRASAGLAVTINGRRKGAGIRFARIPNGPSCGFCTMLASRGFVYASRKSAGEYTRFHDHCDCRIVAGTKDTQVEGYDPEGMYRRYRMCRATLGTLDDVWRDWEALPDEEKDKYGDAPRIPVFSDPEKQRELERFAGKNADAFNDYYAHRITAEMDTRDREWLWSGNAVPIDYSEKPREMYGNLIDPKLPLSRRYRLENITGNDNEIKDVFVHDMLSENGFAVSSRLIINQGGAENIDIDLKGHLCEVKSPEAGPNPGAKDELKFVYRDVQRARHQFEDRVKKQGKSPVPMRIVMSNYYTKFDESREEDIFRRFCYEVRRQGFAEALFVTKAGVVLRAI